MFRTTVTAYRITIVNFFQSTYIKPIELIASSINFKLNARTPCVAHRCRCKVFKTSLLFFIIPIRILYSEFKIEGCNEMYYSSRPFANFGKFSVTKGKPDIFK